MSLVGRLGIAVVLLSIAGFAGTLAIEKVSRQRQALAVCDAAAVGDWDAALVASLDLGTDEVGRSAAQCRCRAYVATGRVDRCAEIVEKMFPTAESWVPESDLAVRVIRYWLDGGRAQLAAAMGRRAGVTYPEDPNLFHLEMSARSMVEDEARVLEDMEGRVRGGGSASTDMSIQLAHRYVKRGRADRALAVLGSAPPTGTPELRGRWFDARAGAYAMAGEADATADVYRAWGADGGDSREIAARRALTFSVSGLEPPEGSTLALLRTAVDTGGLDDAKLAEALVIRLILTLVAGDAHDEAVAVYRRERERFALAGLTEGELLRSAARDQLALGANLDAVSIRFRLHRPLVGGSLWVSPPDQADPDAPYERLALTDGSSASVSRVPAPAPVRWVVRDAVGATRASGTLNLVPGSPREIDVHVGDPIAQVGFDPNQSPADGRRRVFVIVPDCGDWPTYQYLQTRSELPVFTHLVERGYRAVLTSDPPFTAAAMESLVWPDRRSAESFVGSVHQLGTELAGLSSIGTNPFDALRWVLPEARDLFSVVGSGEYVAANFLFSHGKIDAGRHGEFVGPHGDVRQLPVAKTYRAISPAELSRFPALGQPRDAADRARTEIIAAEMDAAVEIARAGEVDLLLLRVEPLDILTHAHFADAAEEGQDDGQRYLFEVYRYLDARLGELFEALDRDDVLIVLSDHGIETSMEHSLDAVFVAAGGGVPVGRAPGAPHLRGVPRVLAALLGLKTTWPDTQVAAWSENAAVAEARGE